MLARSASTQVAWASSAVSLEREAAIINEAALESNKTIGALDFDLQVQDMSKVWLALGPVHRGRWPKHLSNTTDTMKITCSVPFDRKGASSASIPEAAAMPDTALAVLVAKRLLQN